MPARSSVAPCLVALGLLFPGSSGSPALAAPGSWQPAIARVWHGRTPKAKGEEYAGYLAGEIKKFRTIAGNLGYQMMRETVGDETHFMVISYWTSRDAIHAYAGADIRKTRHAPRD
jgi:heme-degrading monooxygenase HmoA